MAKRGINVTFLADVRDFLTGAGKAENALDDIGGALDQVARDGDKATENLERDFRDMATSADRSFDQIAADAKRSFRKVRDSADGALPGKGQSRAAELGSEVGAEFGQNIGEGISSKATGIAGAADVALGTIGATLATLGPAGAAFGVGALFVGSIVSGINAKAAEQRSRIAALVESALSSAVGTAETAGQSVAAAYLKGQATVFAQGETVAEILGLDSTNDALKVLGDLANRTGIEIGTVLAAVGGTGQQALEAQQALRDEAGNLVSTYEDLLKIRDLEISRTGGVTAGTKDQIEALEDAALAASDLLGFSSKNQTAVEDTLTAARLLDTATADQKTSAKTLRDQWVGTADAAERAAAATAATATNIDKARAAAASQDWAAWERALRNAGTAAGTIRAEANEMRVPR